MTTTTFTDGVTPVVADWLNDVDAAIYETLPIAVSELAAHIADTLDAHAASAITNTPAGSIAATTVQAAINELDTDKQPVDTNLTAIADLTSAANKVPRFTGSGTAEVIDVEYGTWTPTLVNITNVADSTVYPGMYTRIGNVVTFALAINITAIATTHTEWTITLPIVSAFTQFYQGSGAISHAIGVVGAIKATAGGSTLNCALPSPSTAPYIWYMTGSYTVL